MAARLASANEHMKATMLNCFFKMCVFMESPSLREKELSEGFRREKGFRLSELYASIETLQEICSETGRCDRAASFDGPRLAVEYIRGPIRDARGWFLPAYDRALVIVFRMTRWHFKRGGRFSLNS